MSGAIQEPLALPAAWFEIHGTDSEYRVSYTANEPASAPDCDLFRPQSSCWSCISCFDSLLAESRSQSIYPEPEEGFRQCRVRGSIVRRWKNCWVSSEMYPRLVCLLIRSFSSKWFGQTGPWPTIIELSIGASFSSLSFECIRWHNTSSKCLF